MKLIVFVRGLISVYGTNYRTVLMLFSIADGIGSKTLAPRAATTEGPEPSCFAA